MEVALLLYQDGDLYLGLMKRWFMVIVLGLLLVGLVHMQDEKITQLIKDLGSSLLKERERATRKLIELGSQVKNC
jgi:hypothetical protein